LADLEAIEIFEVTNDNIELMDHVADDLFDNPLIPAKLTAFLAERTHWMVVALLEGQVIGKCTAMVHKRPDKDDELYIDEIDVIENLRRKGIAKKMLAKVLEMANERGCEECWLGTEQDNIAARRLYESNGAKAEDFVLYYLEY
jgi:ribosomal protein S18 acetylase RimI-like enzyme